MFTPHPTIGCLMIFSVSGFSGLPMLCLPVIFLVFILLGFVELLEF